MRRGTGDTFAHTYLGRVRLRALPKRPSARSYSAQWPGRLVFPIIDYWESDMTRTLRHLFAAAAAFGVVTFASAQTHSGHGSAMQPGAPMQHGQVMGNMSGDRGSQQLHQSMMAGMQDMQRRPMTGDVDKDFVRMMRHHHLQGIEMARIQLQSGDDSEAKRMAQKIIDEQQKEIARFDTWLQRHQ